MNNTEKTMDKIVALCKNRGFIFAGSEIYGGIAEEPARKPLRILHFLLPKEGHLRVF